MLRFFQALFFIGILSLVNSVRADVHIIDINETSENKFPLAVPNFINESGSKVGGIAAKTHALMLKDFQITGMFDVWGEDRLPRDDYNLVDVDFNQWKAFAVQALIKGVLTTADGKPVIQLRLYDVTDGRMLVGKQYALDGDNYIDVAHRFVDSAMKALTGVRGPFESKIVASCGKNLKEVISGFEMDDARRTGYSKGSFNNVSPAWSPDGTRVAYMGRVKNGETHIFISGQGQVTNYKGFGTLNITPSWTPDGNLIFASSRTDDTEIYVVSPSGRILSQLTKSYNADLAPSVSVNGEVAFVSERAGQVHIFKTPLSGGPVTRLTYTGSHNEQPDWSPDGSKIVFSSGGGLRQDIFIMEADGSNIQRLTEGEGSNSSPTWSPDGRFIVFDSTRGGLFIMHADGSHQFMIEKTGGCENADWGPWLTPE